MADTQTQAAPGAAEAGNGGAVVLSAAAVQAYEGMLDLIPIGGDDANERILAAIAQAQDVADLDAPWRSDGMRDFANVPLIVTGVTRSPSAFVDGFGWFLIVTAADKNGELHTITTSAVGIVAQLAKAFAMDALPLRVIPRVAERPTRRGFYPMHLEILR